MWLPMQSEMSRAVSITQQQATGKRVRGTPTSQNSAQNEKRRPPGPGKGLFSREPTETWSDFEHGAVVEFIVSLFTEVVTSCRRKRSDASWRQLRGMICSRVTRKTRLWNSLLIPDITYSERIRRIVMTYTSLYKRIRRIGMCDV